jgi:small subunit ribosomal protein S6
MIFVLQADEPESELEARVAKVESIVTGEGGEMTERNHWGVRQLAYEIQHQTRGNYMHLMFKSATDAIAKLDNEFRLDHKVLRHLIVVDEEWKERNAASMARRRRPGASIPTPPPAPAAVPAGAPAKVVEPAAAPEADEAVEAPATESAPETSDEQ